MDNFSEPQKPNYSLGIFMIGTGLLVLLFAFGSFIIGMWILTSLLCIAGAILYKFYKALNQDRY